jgi:hypothetical protein
MSVSHHKLYSRVRHLIPRSRNFSYRNAKFLTWVWNTTQKGLCVISLKYVVYKRNKPFIYLIPILLMSYSVKSWLLSTFKFDLMDHFPHMSNTFCLWKINPIFYRLRLCLIFLKRIRLHLSLHTFSNALGSVLKVNIIHTYLQTYVCTCLHRTCLRITLI